jgi:hypothetical protein
MLGRTLMVADWNRMPNPVTLLRFRDAGTGIRSANKGFGLGTPDDLDEALGRITGADSFVDVRHYLGEQLHVEAAAGKLRITGDVSSPLVVAKKEARRICRAFLESRE